MAEPVEASPPPAGRTERVPNTASYAAKSSDSNAAASARSKTAYRIRSATVASTAIDPLPLGQQADLAGCIGEAGGQAARVATDRLLRETPCFGDEAGVFEHP